jgi:hypothetical protein
MSNYSSSKQPLISNRHPTRPAPVQCFDENAGYKYPPFENTMSGHQRPVPTEDICDSNLCQCFGNLCICMGQLAQCLLVARIG